MLISAIVAIVGLSYLVFFVIEGQPLSGVARPLGAAVSAASLFVVAFDAYLWRAPGVRLFVALPYIGGTWRGTLTSQWIDPDTETGIPPDPDVYLVVRQTYWSVSARLFTRESKSHTILARVDGDAHGVFGLYALYRNTPRASVRQRSPIHHGALMLDISGTPPNCLEGFYWTDRRTMGEVSFRDRFRQLVNDHEAARRVAGVK